MVSFQRSAQLLQAGRPHALCIIVKTSGSTPRRAASKMIVFPDGTIEGTIGGGKLENLVIEKALSTLKTGQTATLQYQMTDPQKGDPGICGGQLEVYVEPVLEPETILVIGAGHVGKAVASLAHWLGYKVIVADERPGFATPELIPEADQTFTASVAELPELLNIHPRFNVVLCTMSTEVDVAGLPVLLKAAPAYLGVIGSKRRWMATQTSLLEQGISQALIDTIISPMGLEINAETPQEIAVSIMAEIIMLKSGADGKRMHRDQ